MPGDTNKFGNVTNSIFNIRSTLTNAQQTVGALPHGSADERAELNRLIETLDTLFDALPAEHAKDAERVARAVEQLGKDLENQEDKQDVEGTLDRLARAGEKLLDAAPKVAETIGKIAEVVGRLL